MNMLLDEQEQELSNLLSIKDEAGHTVLMIGLLVTVFFDNQLTSEVKEAVTEVAEEYIALVREHLRWGESFDRKTEHPIDSPLMRFPRDWLPIHQDDEGWSFGFHGGEIARAAASPFFIDGFGSSADDDGGLGYLHMRFPLLWFAEGRGTLPDYVLKVCKRLRPLSGYAGIGVLEASDGYARNEWQPTVCEIAERFPGLEIEDRVGHTIHLREGIKGVNWLTILGDRWVQEMGGLDYLRVRLGEEFGFYPYDGGLIIQAGPKPQIGDVQADRWPRLYVTLAKVLKKIQIKNHYPFHFGGKGRRMNHAITNAWLRRFDDK